jgi:hypothetical protein
LKFILGTGMQNQDDDEQTTTNLVGFSEALILINDALDNAGHHLFIKTHTLNHPLITNDVFIEKLKTKLVNSKRFMCHILTEEIKPSKSNSDFVRYYQRLTDFIEIRLFKPEHASADRRQYVIIDEDLLAWQSYEKRHDMRMFTDIHRIKDFTDAFEADWRTSSRDLGLLKLYI